MSGINITFSESEYIIICLDYKKTNINEKIKLIDSYLKLSFINRSVMQELLIMQNKHFQELKEIKKMSTKLRIFSADQK